jgi:hypothetical protein
MQIFRVLCVKKKLAVILVYGVFLLQVPGEADPFVAALLMGSELQQ